MNQGNEETISEDQDNQNQSSNYNIVDEIINQTCIIDDMERRIQKLEKESELYNRKDHYIPIVILITALISLISMLVTIISNFTALNSVNKIIESGLSLFLPSLPFSIGMDLIRYIDYRKTVKQQRHINTKLEILKNKIKEEKEKLESLKQEKNKKNEEIKFKTVKDDKLQQLKQLKKSMYQAICFDQYSKDQLNSCAKKVKNSQALSRKKKKSK